MLGFPPQLTSHVTIPAWYRSGITLFVRRDSDVYHELADHPELPLVAEGPSCNPEHPEDRHNKTSGLVVTTASKKRMERMSHPKTL